MPSNYHILTVSQIAFAASLIILNGLISLALQLKLERSLLVASLRTVFQLSLIGLVLEWVFRWERWYVVIGMLTMMTIIAGVTACDRSRYRFRGMKLSTIISMWVSSWLIVAYSMTFVLHHGGKWYQPQYIIPISGMILGNTLNGVSIGMNTFVESLVKDRLQIEGHLSLGADRWEAVRESFQNAVRTGMIPIVNAMSIVGIVSLPGMMTGQLLSGTPPIEAVKYQIVIMFLIASATSLGTLLVVWLSYRRLFSRYHQLLIHRIRPKQTNRS